MGRPFKKCQNNSPSVLLPSKFSSSVVICAILFSLIAIKSICGVQLSAENTKDANLTPPSGQRSTSTTSSRKFDGSVGGNGGEDDGGDGVSGGSVYHSSIGPSGGTKLAKKRSRHAAATENDRDRLIGPIRGRP